MSRRQALGVLTNNTNANNGAFASKNPATANNNNGAGQKVTNAPSIFKSVASNNNLLLNQIQFNDENEPPQFVLASLQGGKAKASDLDFEIFQEENVERKEIEERVELIDDEEEQEEEEEDEDEDEDEEDEEDEPLSNKENDDGLEEEGISRLNLAAMCSNSQISAAESAAKTTAELMMMDSMHNDSSSPMMLDDTIKFLSKIDDHDLEEDEEEEQDNEPCDEDDEETRRKFEIQERENTLMNCLEYKDDILAYMRQLECEQRPKSNYMKKQLDITGSMRSILVDWLVEVCEEYKLNVETLYLAVNYTDRFLSQMSVLRGKLQLVGTASMYIAAKYEEITPPDVNEFVYITDDTYTKKQVLRMEHLLLKVLDFRMSPPTVNWFLSHYLRFIKLQTSLNQANNIDLYTRIENLARYLAELTLIDADTYLTYLPSQIAASAIYLAMYTLGRPWTRQIADILGYPFDLNELKPCLNDLLKTMQQADAHPQQAIQEKYKQSKYDYVALIEPPKSLPSFLAQ